MSKTIEEIEVINELPVENVEEAKGLADYKPDAKYLVGGLVGTVIGGVAATVIAKKRAKKNTEQKEQKPNLICRIKTRFAKKDNDSEEVVKEETK